MASNNRIESSVLPKNITRDQEKRIIAVYNACKHNDILNVGKYLSSMTIKEINYQNPVDGNTILHEATRLGYMDIIKLLLNHNIIRSLRNNDGKISFDLAETKDIQELFKRSQSDPRFSLASNNRLSKSSNGHDIKCKSCSLINEDFLYEWELVDDLAYQNALRLCDELKSNTSKKFLEKAIFSIDKGYLKSSLMCSNSIDFIRHCFKQAMQENNPVYILKAYTKCQDFTKQLNMDMARNFIHDLNKGCSLFSCDYLYSTQDATRSISSILLYHPQIQSLNFVGKVYRGLYIKESLFSHYAKQSRIITTTFLSTSKRREVAEGFSAPGDSIQNTEVISILCIYTIKSQNHTAIDIVQHSEYPDEDEVLLLPYSAFDIIDIKNDKDRNLMEIYLEQCDATSLNL